MKVLFLRPPTKLRYISNFFDDPFVTPLAYLTLIAYLREKTSYDIDLLDCTMDKVGWKSLDKFLSRNCFDVVMISCDETFYGPETFRACELVKKHGAKVVIGGHYPTSDYERVLKEEPVDFIVHGEGEITTLDLLKHIDENNVASKNISSLIFGKIKGISFLNEKGEVCFTGQRGMISDLDILPFPAYDIVLRDSTGKIRKGGFRWAYYPKGLSVYHGRGCVDSCEFCSCWVQYCKGEGDDRKPIYRTKSPRQMFDEIIWLYEEYGVDYFTFIDDTWNVDSEWQREFSSYIIKSGIKINFFALLRPDFLYRDLKNGVFDLCYKAGLRFIHLGLEREGECEQIKSAKLKYNTECVRLIKEEYPDVLVKSTFVLGDLSETSESAQNVINYSRRIGSDINFFVPLTPFLGTKLRSDLEAKGISFDTELSKYDMSTVVFDHPNLGREGVSDFIVKGHKTLFLSWNTIKGCMQLSFKGKVMRSFALMVVMIGISLLMRFSNPFMPTKKKMNYVIPRWHYD